MSAEAEHGEADTEHSNIGYELVEQFAITNETQVKVLRALQKGLSIWWAVTDGVVRECERLKRFGVMEYWSSGVMGNSKNEAMKQRLLEYWRAEE